MFTQSSVAQEADALTSFGAWSIFKDDVACWAASAATEVNIKSDAINEDNVMMYVSFFQTQSVPQISFLIDTGLADSMIADAGGVRADFFSDGEGNYFATDSERDLLFAMLRSQQLALSSPASSTPIVTFSLDAFKDAYNHLAEICEFKQSDFFDSDVT